MFLNLDREVRGTLRSNIELGERGEGNIEFGGGGVRLKALKDNSIRNVDAQLFEAWLAGRSGRAEICSRIYSVNRLQTTAFTVRSRARAMHRKKIFTYLLAARKICLPQKNHDR